LIADDNWVNRQLLIKLLDPLGFELRDVENGQGAVELAQTFEPHLIWMDIRMPVMDGNQATQQIKAGLNGSSIVIIALTASAFDEERADIAAMGYDDFLRKPFRPSEIYGLISKHLGVRYEYAPTASNDTEPVDKNNDDHQDLKSELNALSSDLVSRLTEGIELGDNQMLEDVIVEIQQHNPQLALVLTRLVEQFEYDALLTLVREVVD
jgi:CheY-like chemotaxis protein